MSFNHKTIEELHDLLVSKEISATELTQATLDDIKAREDSHQCLCNGGRRSCPLRKLRPLMKMESMQITFCQGFRLLSRTISQQMAS